MLAWAVRDLATGEMVGSTRYHDIMPAIDRVEIGYTWYAKSRQRSSVNTSCKLLLLSHAFEMARERRLHRRRKHGHPILVALAAAHHDLIAREVHILDAQVAAFEHPQPGAVK